MLKPCPNARESTSLARPASRFVSGRDGFLSLNANGTIRSGYSPGMRIRERQPFDVGGDYFATPSAGEVSVKLPDGRVLKKQVGDSDPLYLRISELKQLELGHGLNPKRGGKLKLELSSPGAASGDAELLVLSADYAGPILIVDIDDTLRLTHKKDVVADRQIPPIDGAVELLQKAAALGVPVVYLSAAPDQIHRYNERFLAQFPSGILMDREKTGLGDLNRDNQKQAEYQGAYKARSIRALKSEFPKARLFGLGDDRYGDAIAYTREGVRAYIRDAPQANNIPDGFNGVITQTYDAAFIAKVTKELEEALA